MRSFILICFMVFTQMAQGLTVPDPVLERMLYRKRRPTVTDVRRARLHELIDQYKAVSSTQRKIKDLKKFYSRILRVAQSVPSNRRDTEAFVFQVTDLFVAALKSEYESGAQMVEGYLYLQWQIEKLKNDLTYTQYWIHLFSGANDGMRLVFLQAVHAIITSLDNLSESNKAFQRSIDDEIASLAAHVPGWADPRKKVRPFTPGPGHPGDPYHNRPCL